MTDQLPYTYTDDEDVAVRVGPRVCTVYDRPGRTSVGFYTPAGEDAVAMARAVLAAAGDTGHLVVSTEEIGQIIEDSTAIGARSMRERAMRAASDAPGTPYTPTEAIRALPLLADDENPVDPQGKAPRDTELIQQVRALVKRYGAPWVAYEAARQARH